MTPTWIFRLAALVWCGSAVLAAAAADLTWVAVNLTLAVILVSIGELVAER